jgi:hypothetical protein
MLSISESGRRVLALLAALTIAAGATACGSSDDDGAGDSGGAASAQAEPLDTEDYLERVNDAQTEFATDAAKLDLANPSSAKDFGQSLGDLTGLIDHLRQQLAEIEPPEDVASEHDALVRQLGDYGDVIEQEQGALSSGNAAKAQAAARKVGKASTTFSQEFDATIRQINDNLGLKTETSGG